MKIKLTRPLAFIDLETTGLNIMTDRIVEIAINKITPEGSTHDFHQLVNPEIEIPENVTKIHGITGEIIKDKPNFSKIAKDILSFLDNSDLSGYNIMRFDLPLLMEEFLRAGIDFSIENRKIIDVQHIFHKLEKRDLFAAYKFYCGKELENHHSAKYDIEATREVFEAQLQKYEFLPDNINAIYDYLDKPADSMVDLAGRIVMENGQVIFNFGKYKGIPVFDVFKKDPSYYKWMMDKDFPQYTKKKLTELYIKYRNQTK